MNKHKHSRNAQHKHYYDKNNPDNKLLQNRIQHSKP